jgi:hypothetical protein
MLAFLSWPTYYCVYFIFSMISWSPPPSPPLPSLTLSLLSGQWDGQEFVCICVLLGVQTNVHCTVGIRTRNLVRPKTTTVPSVLNHDCSMPLGWALRPNFVMDVPKCHCQHNVQNLQILTPDGWENLAFDIMWRIRNEGGCYRDCRLRFLGLFFGLHWCI